MQIEGEGRESEYGHKWTGVTEWHALMILCNRVVDDPGCAGNEWDQNIVYDAFVDLVNVDDIISEKCARACGFARDANLDWFSSVDTYFKEVVEWGVAVIKFKLYQQCW